MAKLRGGAPVPVLPFSLLPLRNGVLFPGTVLTFPVGRERSVTLVQSLHVGDVIGVVTQKNGKAEEPTRDDLYDRGTFARVVEVVRLSAAEYRLTLEGLDRFQLGDLVRRDPFWQAEGEKLEETVSDAGEAEALALALRQHLAEIAAQGGALAQVLATRGDDPGVFADRVAAALGLPSDKEIQVLDQPEVVARLRLVASLVTEAKTVAEVKQKVDADVRKELGKNQREAILREQIRALKKELGDEGDKDSDVDKLRERLAAADLPAEVREVAERELRRLSGQPGPDAHVIRNYLEWIVELPWNARAEAKNDLDAISAKLDADHAGLGDVKKRILEHMAVLALTGESRGTILCLAGPPGVGKTSLGQSIADATGRPFVRVSLGGVGDEAELRGHRRTYVGSLPGRIVHALKKVKVKNPVILLDEIDKLGSGWRGSPEAALLEILDPEQNKSFVDHYMELPFDLSEVLFVCTANDLGNLSAPLRDRLEIVELAGYTADEKVAIAKSHLLPKRVKQHGLSEDALAVTDAALQTIVRDYTREAGVRQLDREITKLCRSVALDVMKKRDEKPVTRTVDVADLASILGKVRYFADVAERTAVPGVATGLAWTPVGGDILFIETSRMPGGKGHLEITGQLGDVMKESARAALTYVRSHAEELGVDLARLEKDDLHIHVPAGAVPKDGPSAGVTMFTALTSLLTGRRVRPDTAMTGECTLRGRVLPVGGIKAKVLAAHRAGITRVILPKKNQRDLDEIPKEVLDHMEVFFAEEMRDVLAAALEAEPTSPTAAPGEPTKAATAPIVG